MGLLDDAIRQHLDLKRRKGADPREVALLEREALGLDEYDRQIEQEANADRTFDIRVSGRRGEHRVAADDLSYARSPIAGRPYGPDEETVEMEVAEAIEKRHARSLHAFARRSGPDRGADITDPAGEFEWETPVRLRSTRGAI